MLINEDRLAGVFTSLCEIDSPSRREGQVAAYLKRYFADFKTPPEIFEDDSSGQTGADCGNLIIRFAGSLPLEPIFFNCHMDTVMPGLGVTVARRGDTFYSAGETVLGADDKAGIAILIEAMHVLQEANIPHGPVEFLFTTCEEVGLLGAKALDPSLLQARMGYALDSTGTDMIIIGAPAARSIIAEISGASAHAGLNPEKGISAIQLAARAIAEAPLGRIDDESTANIGRITGGMATNIIPEFVKVEGEARSHDPEKLDRIVADMQNCFTRAVDGWTDPTGQATGRPSLVFSAPRQYPALRLRQSDTVVQRIERAASSLSRSLEFIIAGGGSDANVLSGYGLKTAIVGIGMTDVHTTDESIALSDMIRTTELICFMLTI